MGEWSETNETLLNIEMRDESKSGEESMSKDVGDVMIVAINIFRENVETRKDGDVRGTTHVVQLNGNKIKTVTEQDCYMSIDSKLRKFW